MVVSKLKYCPALKAKSAANAEGTLKDIATDEGVRRLISSTARECNALIFFDKNKDLIHVKCNDLYLRFV
jgi:hypothetical protein